MNWSTSGRLGNGVGLLAGQTPGPPTSTAAPAPAATTTRTCRSRLRRWRLPTNVVGCTDAIEDGVTGLLVPPRDVAALVAAFRRYVEDATLRRRHDRAARERVVRMFRQEQIWETLHDGYQRPMRGKA